ncbi:hypothetical protein CGZ93_09430 [Enemella dayhoffiae]|uniref:Uncharacterized protein n=1 Tax=Enemella dayhoffiae TaxID=2016507 RepID=A0A255H366_9ACTN|nr:hypothetical protein [Enemella dayhoffiae]OYO22111.1 hypothetical protein CGZ93_09430 [Enemella dayhoffiae]
MTEPQQAKDPGPVPTTGHARVDGVLADLADLAERPLTEHHDALARAHEDLHRVLSDPDDESTGAGNHSAAGGA